MTGAGRNLSWYEASARARIAVLVDEGSFVEVLGPEAREISPHLGAFGLPVQFDDGVIVGTATLGGRPLLIAAQEGRFAGGAIGEVHGAKITGVLRAARELERDVALLLDTGGVRLQEANAGEVAIAEIIRAIFDVRRAGRQVIALIGGRAGCFGGGGLIAACCSTILVSEQGRIGVTGPEVIETNCGIEEFDSADRALVWRTVGGKHRYLTGGADSFVSDDIADFRRAALLVIGRNGRMDLGVLMAEQARLEQRAGAFGGADATDIWRTLGIAEPDAVPGLSTADFLALSSYREPFHDAR